MMKILQYLTYRAKLRSILSEGKFFIWLSVVSVYVGASAVAIAATIFWIMYQETEDLWQTIVSYYGNLTSRRYLILLSALALLGVILVFVLTWPSFYSYRRTLKRNLRDRQLEQFWGNDQALFALSASVAETRANELRPVQEQLAVLERRYKETVRQYSNYAAAKESLEATRERLSGELEFYQSIQKLTSAYHGNSKR